MLTIIADAMLKASDPKNRWDAPDHWRAPTRLRAAPRGEREDYDFQSKWSKHTGLW